MAPRVVAQTPIKEKKAQRGPRYRKNLTIYERGMMNTGNKVSGAQEDGFTAVIEAKHRKSLPAPLGSAQKHKQQPENRSSAILC
jgi:hypothetical protein